MFALSYAFSGKPAALGTVDESGTVKSFYEFPSTDTVYLPIRGADALIKISKRSACALWLRKRLPDSVSSLSKCSKRDSPGAA